MAYLLITLAFFLAIWCAVYLAFGAWLAMRGGRLSVAACAAMVALGLFGIHHTIEAIEAEYHQTIHRAD